MAERPPTSALDRPIARIVALGVCALSLGVLGYIHRDELFPGEAAEAAAADDPFARCFAERSGQIDAMLRDGTIRPDQARLFRQRAEALCRAQNPAPGRGGAGPPGRP